MLKERHVAAREKERKKIIQYLKEKGWTASNDGGRGSTKYGKGLKKKYDLTNWKYIEATLGDISIFISLQAFDRDKVTNNYHVLMDRLGLSIFPVGSKPDHFTIMEDMPFDLPLGESELEELHQYIMNEINKASIK